MGCLNKCGKFLNSIARAFTMFFVAIMFVSTVLQVFFRYFLNAPLSWSDELARYCLVYLTFVGGSVGVREGSLACINLVTEHLSEKAGRMLRFVNRLLSLGILAVLFYWSILLVSDPSIVNQKSPSMRYSMAYVFFSLPFGLGFSTFHALVQLMEDFFRGSEKKCS